MSNCPREPPDLPGVGNELVLGIPLKGNMTFRVLGMNQKGIPLEEAKSGMVFLGVIPTHFRYPQLVVWILALVEGN